MLWTAFLIGLVGSFHCIGMCGPIAFVLPINRKSNKSIFIQTFLYQFGRIITYGIIGLIFGLVGKGMYLAGFQQRLSILIGILMILIVLIPIKKFNKYNFSKPLNKFIGIIKSKLGFYLNQKTNSALFLVGFFNGFLPCGLVYMALIGSIATANSIDGGLYMVVFGLGTLPLMTVAVLFGNFISINVRQKIQKAIPVFVIFIGLLFILRGLGLGIPYISPSDANLQISNNSEHCVTVEVN